MNRTTTRGIGLLLCIALLTTVAAPAAAQADRDEFRVELDAEGNADIVITSAYDLDSETEQAAFEELRANTTAQEELVERFENRMTAVVEDASEATDREMAVSNAHIEVETTDDAGVITLALHWSALAAAEDGRLTVTEPFTSGFEPDRPFTVTAPDGYEVASATSEASHTGETTATWDAGASFSVSQITFVADEDATSAPDPESDTEAQPGFGIGVTLVAVLGAALLATRYSQP